MKSQADEVKHIAAQLLAGMLANPHTYQVYSTESGKLSKEQQTELIEKANRFGRIPCGKNRGSYKRTFET